LGQALEAGAAVFAIERIGNGSRGNVGADALSHLVTRQAQLSGGITRVRNPLPAQGGTEPEPMAEVKLFAPFAFRKDLQRAITADDYAQLVQRDFKGSVQRAAAVLNWTGSWYEAQTAVDPLATEEADLPLLDAIGHRLYRYRRIGHDLNVTGARYVSLDIAMTVCVLPHYLRGHVEAALLDEFSNRMLPNGKRGFFHPDNQTFGEGIYLSRLIALAQAVTGVESVMVTRLERLYAGPNSELERGLLPLGPLEVARLDNDADFPERGRLVLDVRGGQ
jgi:predicted phage baseplate assembly protein